MPSSRILGSFAILCYAIHASAHLTRGEPQDLLWACHVAAVLVGFGLVTGSATLNAIGLLWSCFGTPLWILDLATGGEWIPTALLTHAAAIAFGLTGVQRLGMPRGAALTALAAYLPLWAITRAVTPPWANVNVAFSVYQGWQKWFTSYPRYSAMLLALALLTFVIAQQLLLWLSARERVA